MTYPPGVLEQPFPAASAGEVLTYLGRKSFGWLVTLLLLLLEYGLFRQAAQREVTWAYPANHDQAVFLRQSYETYEKFLDEGLPAGLWHGFNLMGPENTLADQQKSLRENRSCKPAARRRADNEQVLRLYDEIAKYCRAFDWKEPRISTTSMVDYLNFNVARVLFLDVNKVRVPPETPVEIRLVF